MESFATFAAGIGLAIKSSHLPEGPNIQSRLRLVLESIHEDESPFMLYKFGNTAREALRKARAEKEVDKKTVCDLTQIACEFYLKAIERELEKEHYDYKMIHILGYRIEEVSESVAFYTPSGPLTQNILQISGWTEIHWACRNLIRDSDSIQKEMKAFIETLKNFYADVPGSGFFDLMMIVNKEIRKTLRNLDHKKMTALGEVAFLLFMKGMENELKAKEPNYNLIKNMGKRIAIIADIVLKNGERKDIREIVRL